MQCKYLYFQWLMLTHAQCVALSNIHTLHLALQTGWGVSRSWACKCDNELALDTLSNWYRHWNTDQDLLLASCAKKAPYCTVSLFQCWKNLFRKFEIFKKTWEAKSSIRASSFIEKSTTFNSHRTPQDNCVKFSCITFAISSFL